MPWNAVMVSTSSMWKMLATRVQTAPTRKVRPSRLLVRLVRACLSCGDMLTLRFKG